MSETNELNSLANFTEDSSLPEINEKFRELIRRIDEVQKYITNLDLLRIQLVYRPAGDTPSLTEFMTTCWAKLATYHAVYFELENGQTFNWTDSEQQVREIKLGDYLVKLPDNGSLYIKGNDNYYYSPSSYDTASGQLTFTLTNQGEAQVPLVMPLWQQGSGLGHATACTMTSAYATVSLTLPQSGGITDTILAHYSPFIYGGKYYIQNEQIVFAPSHIDIDPGEIVSNFVKLTITFPTPIDQYYIPYISMAASNTEA